MIPWLPDDTAFISSLIWTSVDRHRSFVRFPFTLLLPGLLGLRRRFVAASVP